MKKRAPRSVLEIAIAKAGYRKGMRIALFVAQWTIAQSALGHTPTVDEAADWWRENRATWFRRQAEFREVFDLAENPGPMAAELIEHSERKQLARRDVSQVVAWLAGSEVGVT